MGPLPVEGLASVVAPGRMQQRMVPANDSTPLHFFREQQGTYDVQVRTDGYPAWDTGGERVTFAADGCTVESAVLRALMQAAE